VIHRPQERGSALLIVFVLAAVIAIMLYRELPVTAFEARRQKEQTLIDRGHVYQRAVQLYYRTFRGRYPANVAQLENTNNVRFLRNRYVDPFTGKDDWRQLHAGPGGMLMDSKVQNLNQNIFGQGGNRSNGTNGSGSTFGGAGNTNTANSSTFGSSTFGDSSSSSSDSDVTVPQVRKRGPAIATGGEGTTPSTSELNQDPSTPLLPTTDSASAGATTPNAAGPNDTSQASQQAPAQTAPGAAATPGQGGTAFGAGPTPTSPNGTSLGGAFAGVASKAKGHTIKKINDQTDYSLWEFWYDPNKDTSMSNTGSVQNGAGGQNLQTGTQPTQPASSGFGSSGFGSTGFSSFGTQSTQTPPNAPTATVPDNSANSPTTAQPTTTQ
jgi:hypothetical protein